MSTIVEMDAVGHAYGGVPTVDDIDLKIDEGSFIGIIGPSGAGKSTLLRLMLGTLTPTSGRIRRLGNLRMAYVPQVGTVDWNFPITVAEVVMMAKPPRSFRPWATAKDRTEVDEVLAQLGLDGLASRHIRELSGGQQQRVFLARALLRQPQLLVLDEPTSGVDVRTRHEIVHLLTDLNTNGLTIVLTTHDVNGMAAHLPVVACLNQRLIACGPPNHVLNSEVLESTFGAPMDVLEHGGMLLVAERGMRTA